VAGTLAPAHAVSEGVAPRIIVLLTAAVFINYLDRGNLATAGPLIRDELTLSNAQFGTLLSAFFWTYTPAQLLAGWLAERHDPRAVLAAGLAVWGIATALTGLASGFALLLAFRLLLGLGESVMYPAGFKILAVARDEQRGRANGVLAIGQSLGPAVGTLLGGLLMAWVGWRAVFLATGLLSLLWLWPWLKTGQSPDASPARRASAGPASRQLLRNRELWGCALGHFCMNYALYLVLSWLPTYLVKALGFSLAAMAQLAAGIYCLYALVSVASGWAADRWRLAGASANRVRKSALIAGLGGLAVCFTGCSLAGPVGAILALAGCGACFGLLTPALFATTQTLAGPDAAGRWMGVQNFVANFASMAAPIITGIAVDRTGGFEVGFLIATVVALAGIFAFAFLVRRIEPVEWPSAPAP
jgi:MFS family permease